MKNTVLRLILMSSLIIAPVMGQTSAINGEITGTVVDPSSAPIANAKVRAMNVGTDYQQTAVTTSAGLYRLPVLPIGEYSLTIEGQGFAPYKRSGIRLSAGSAATVDVKLELQGVVT